MKTILIILSLYNVISCWGQNAFDSLQQDTQNFKNWAIEIEELSIDTSVAKAILPNPKVKLTFHHQTRSSCPAVTLDFYPIELKDAIEKRLNTYLYYRSSLTPPPPKEFTSTDYYILAWNLNANRKEKICECETLETKLVDHFELRKHPGEKKIRQIKIEEIKTDHNNN